MHNYWVGRNVDNKEERMTVEGGDRQAQNSVTVTILRWPGAGKKS